MVMRAPCTGRVGASVSKPTCRICGPKRTSLRASRPSLKDVKGARRPWRLAAASPDDLESSFNPLKKKDKSKEDAAKKALVEMFSGKKDVLADFDGGGDDDGGDGGSQGGGGGGGWSWDEFKGNFGSFGSNFLKWLKSMGKTLGAVLLFISVFVGMACLGPLTKGAVTFVRLLLRLDKPKEVFTDTSAPAGTQRSALFDDDEEESGTKEGQTGEGKSEGSPTEGISPA